jgi:hypothetical protein
LNDANEHDPYAGLVTVPAEFRSSEFVSIDRPWGGKRIHRSSLGSLVRLEGATLSIRCGPTLPLGPPGDLEVPISDIVLAQSVRSGGSWWPGVRLDLTDSEVVFVFLKSADDLLSALSRSGVTVELQPTLVSAGRRRSDDLPASISRRATSAARSGPSLGRGARRTSSTALLVVIVALALALAGALLALRPFGQPWTFVCVGVVVQGAILMLRRRGE